MSFFQSKMKDGTVNIQAFGYVTKDPFITQSGKLILFTVCYGKDKYIDCKAFSSSKSGELAACLEKHDEVGVAGVWEQYKDKDGNDHDQIRVDFLTVQMEAPQAEETAEAKPSEQTNGFTDISDEEGDGELPF